jgi:cell division septation protein DedD
MSDQQDAGKDTEIVLGTGKLLGIFFGLVAICGTFFGLGYSVGRSSSPMALQSGPTTLASSSGAKPAAGVTVTAAPAPVTEATPPVTDQNSAANAQPQQVPPPQPTAAADTSNTTPNPDVKTVAASQNPSLPETAAQGNITVQVAAVSKQEDAEALVAALRRKNYPVFVPPSPSTDNLYHVQVGPFAELKDAEAMKSKLASDGYNAIVKK